MVKAIVGMATSYKNITQSDWLWHQTPQPFGVWNNIQMQAKAERPDVLLLYNFNFQPPAASSGRWRSLLNRVLPDSPNRTYQPADYGLDLRQVPRERVIYLMREPPLPEIVHLNQRDYTAAKTCADHIFGPDDLAPTPDYMPAIWYHANSFRELDEMPPPEKVNACSWITSGISRTANHRKRLDFMRQVQTSGMALDFYGRGLPHDIQSGGELKNKWSGMAPYYYNLSIENYADNDWYVSEKLWDSLLAWCLPIYYGGSAADRLLPPGSFLRLPSMDERGVAYIQEVIATPEAWHQAREAIAEARQVILHKLNLLNWVSEFVDKLGGCQSNLSI